jgi:hypothetical protein
MAAAICGNLAEPPFTYKYIPNSSAPTADFVLCYNHTIAFVG